MKNGMRMAKLGVVAVGLALCLVLGYASNASAMLTAAANHDHITIDFFYHGSTVGVKGLSDPGRDLVVKITSPEGHQMLKKKGKVGGVLWMNVGSLTFENAPNLYEVFSSKKIEDILTPEEQQKYLTSWQEGT